MRVSLLLAAIVSTATAFAPQSSFRASTSLRMSEEAAATTGTVKWFNTEKGFGFITPDVDGDDVFVHQTAIHSEGFRSLADGESVEYTTEVDPNSGKTKASFVSGPGGEFVKGAPYEEEY
mmetsp:Transcript_25474/g.46077  ORF Transcript_25474/g.46077 Transcript_25474/m.46077 type:complete len:120 (-) Transcript_25474:206-565(-)|eukprot:CAMPEP_0201608308 /NCGR_PEP_ID=MMETSP0492-20130828/7125_1 /ASSEMBLY_ACC=CAM_ASM_000837 /TAXON_ID=420259 /ORGANISM="Thalassiosira gravida, Strain GMp14c1" /LENGTH=119 /DNA_ID=CAMNT_0048073053 /DNA_START=67 /DNA_END=429 /DNA_ORIENTATION=+